MSEGQSGREDRYQDPEEYKRYLAYAMVVSIFIAIMAFLSLAIAVINPDAGPPVVVLSSPNSVASIISGIVLFFIFVLCVSSTTTAEDFAQMRRLFEKHDVSWIARTATGVFALYTLAVLVLVMSDGGSSSSPFASVLLINATFGYSFSKSKIVRVFSSYGPLLLYVLALFFVIGDTGFDVLAFDPRFSLYMSVALLVWIMNPKIGDKVADVKKDGTLHMAINGDVKVLNIVQEDGSALIKVDDE